MTFVLALGIVMIVGCAFLLVEVATLPSRQRRESLGRATSYAGDLGVVQARPQAAFPFARAFTKLVERVVPPAMLESIDQRLNAAGLTWRITPAGFMAIKVGLSLAGLALGALVGAAAGSSGRGFLFALALGAAMFIAPDRFIASKVRTRKERLAGDLPDALDLLAISIEAGLSLDAALAQLVDHLDGPLADEFQITLGEIRVGENRQDAMRRLADRCNLPSVSALARAVIQSDQLGMPLGRILRVQARDVRIQRQQAAEERANKMPVKMLFPTAIFIFPVLFFVVLGPALIELFKVL